ncbi:MAG: hypothetical protein WDO24_03220 [Pseudomonadota bacterium]
MLERAAYLPSSINGGARSAEEVTAHSTIKPISSGCATGPSAAADPATKGSARNARHGHRGDDRDQAAEPPDQARDAVGRDPHGVVRNREDGLIEQQNPNHRRARNADRAGQLRQEDRVDGPSRA